MTRGGAPKTREAPERRCIATGRSGGVQDMVRFVLDPEGVITPDLAERLPGRGVWVTSERSALERAVKKNLFAKSLRAPVKIPPDLVAEVERQLSRRAVEAIALCRKAGLAVAGFERAKAAAPSGAALVQASDGAEDGRKKMRRLAKGLTELTCLMKSELGLAFGRPSVIHVVLTVGGATDRAVRECMRLQGFRHVEATGDSGPEPIPSVAGRGRGSKDQARVTRD